MKTVLIFLFLVVGTFGSPPFKPDCTHDDDCILGGNCVDRSCIIETRASLGNSCKRDSDCHGHRQCINGKCAFWDSRQGTGVQCHYDEDCLDGRVCSTKGSCIQPRGFLPECIFDRDCPRKEQKCFAGHCGFDNSKRRLSMCNPDIFGECTMARKNFGNKIRCAEDKDCPDGKVCTEGVCTFWHDDFAAKTCSLNTDCPNYQLCFQGGCINKPDYCKKDGDCQKKPSVCVNNLCGGP